MEDDTIFKVKDRVGWSQVAGTTFLEKYGPGPFVVLNVADVPPDEQAGAQHSQYLEIGLPVKGSKKVQVLDPETEKWVLPKDASKTTKKPVRFTGLWFVITTSKDSVEELRRIAEHLFKPRITLGG